MEGWDSFFVATVGAAAALAGLIIVAMTVNIDTIIKNAGLPSRAGATVASLILVVIAGGAALIPRIGLVGLGGVVLAATAIATVLYLRSGYEGFRHRTRASKPLIKLAWSVIQMAPYIVGAVLLLLGDASGLYWIAGGILLTFVGSTLNAWVLLVEILR